MDGDAQARSRLHTLPPRSIGGDSSFLMGQFYPGPLKRLYLPDFVGDFWQGESWKRESNFVHRMVQLLVGPLESWPALFRASLPVVAAPLWFIFCAALESAQIIPGQESWKIVFHESLVVGLCAYLPWCHLLAGLVFIYFLNSYIYMGPSPLWNYLHTITRKALTPLYLLPLQISKIDFTPVAAMAIIFLIYENGVRFLSALFTFAMR